MRERADERRESAQEIRDQTAPDETPEKPVLRLEYTLDYYDGPTVFFALLDQDPIYAELVSDELGDDREFAYWRLRKPGRLAEVLSGERDGTFRSTGVSGDFV